MIQSLHISNYALIDSIDIDFTPGLNIITGETGAGKSIMLGALGLILGERADLQAIADTSRKSVIEAVFNVSDPQAFRAWFATNDYDWAEDNTITLRREIVGSRSRAFINDTPVNLDKLQWIASRLVDIHSQHQNALLSDPDFQLDILDSLSGNGDLLQDYTKAFKDYKRALKDYHETRRRIQKNRTDEDFIRFQLEQLEDLDLQDGEKEELERERDTIANLAEVKEDLSGAISILSSGDVNISDMLDSLSGHIASISQLLDADDKIEERLETIRVDINDITDTLIGIDSNIHGDTNDLDAIDDRLKRINELEERHSVSSTSQLIAIQSKLKSQLDELEGSEIVLTDLEKRARKAKATARDIARQLTESRQAKARWLEETLCRTARPLGMSNLMVNINLSSTELCPTGGDTVEFLFAFNKNQKLMPVKGAASGGEISRLMLSLKSIIAQTMALPTIIFDEVDTGVSGDVANRMGHMMLDIAATIQVIAITHLPQVAAKGATHFKVYKHDDEQSTHTHIRCLNSSERIDELALMLSGSTDNSAARQTAIDLISSSNLK